MTLIGISASFHDFGDYGAVGVPRPLAMVGAVPVILPRAMDALEATLDRLDGVVLAPGRDIEPRRYGQEVGPSLAATEPERDAFELELVPRVLERGLPVLGMCRGIQVLNVALGGTLVQHLGDDPRWRDHPTDPGWKAWKRSSTRRWWGTRPRRTRATRSTSPRGACCAPHSGRRAPRSARSTTRRSTAWPTACA